jgi:hypothetical protein
MNEQPGRCPHHGEWEQNDERAALQVSRMRAMRIIVPPRRRNPHSIRVLLDSEGEKRVHFLKKYSV